MQESTRIQAVQSPVIPIVGDLVRAHPGTINLGQGMVFYGPPPEALARLGETAAEPGSHGYQSVAGLPRLRELFEQKLAAENGVSVRPDRHVLVTAGGNMGFMNAVLAVADPGDEIVLPSPFYFNHEMAVRIAGCRPILVATDETYQLQPDAICGALSPRTRAVVTVSPNNPTGAVYRETDLRRVNEICRGAGVYHISDEAYEYFTFDGREHFSPGSIDGAAEHTIQLFSMSKAYGMASWRIGFMLIPRHLVAAVRKIQDTILICPPVVSQEVAIGALEVGSDYCRRHVDALAEVRQMVLETLTELGDRITVPPTEGAFYFLVRLESEMPPMAVVDRLIREHQVAAIPGTAFGVEDACTLRVAYGALEKRAVAEGLGRFVRGIRQVLGI